jgi:ankyrin repeat protein
MCTKQHEFERHLEILLHSFESEQESWEYSMKSKLLELLDCSHLIPSSNGNSALRIFSYVGDIDLIQKLLKHTNFVITGEDGGDSLCMAAIMGQTEIVDIFLNDGRFNPALKMRLYMNEDGHNALEYACGNGYLDIVELLLIDPRVDPTVNGNLAVSLSAGNGYSDVLKRLLQDPRIQKTCSLHDALIEAVLEESVECIQILLRSSWID